VDIDRTELLALVREAVAEVLAADVTRVTKPKSGLLSLDEASEFIRTPKSTIRFWIWQGRLESYKPGRHLLVKEADLLDLVKSNETVSKRAAKTRKCRGRPKQA
jgi:excisionase family DNA binding protein